MVIASPHHAIHDEAAGDRKSADVDWFADPNPKP